MNATSTRDLLLAALASRPLTTLLAAELLNIPRRTAKNFLCRMTQAGIVRAERSRGKTGNAAHVEYVLASTPVKQAAEPRAKAANSYKPNHRRDPLVAFLFGPAHT